MTIKKIIAGFVASVAAITMLIAAPANAATLPYSPPTLTAPVTITIPAAGGTFSQPNNVDCLIKAPVKITGPVTLKGCDDRVWQGGIFGGRLTKPSGSYDSTHRGIRLSDGSDTGTDYLQGLWFKEGYLSDAIQIAHRTNNGRTVVIQDVRIDATLYGTKSGVHSDAIQAWGGPRTLLVYGFTAKKVGYQGWYLDPCDSRTCPTGVGTAWRYDNVNLECATGCKYLYADRRPAFTKASASNFWIFGSPYNNKDSFGNAPTGVQVGKVADFVPASKWSTGIYIP
jgi:hypothetical protein